MIGLSRRERQIMDVCFMLGHATAAEIRDNLPEPVSEDSVRKLIRILEHKGHLSHKRVGRSHVYRPRISAEDAERQAMRHVLKTFFRDSASKAVSTLLDVADSDLNPQEIDEIQARIEEARRRGR
ncbi:MAG: BlaI/MecI/CopY family transcriptional regulator [Candidatus Krumholzibacteriia bacterium]